MELNNARKKGNRRKKEVIKMKRNVLITKLDSRRNYKVNKTMSERKEITERRRNYTNETTMKERKEIVKENKKL